MISIKTIREQSMKKICLLLMMSLMGHSSLADIWLSGQRVADANAPVVKGEWHGGFESCLEEANRTHEPLLAIFVSEGDACTFCEGFRNAADTDVFKNWLRDSGCIALYMETAADWSANGGNGYAFPESEAFRWVDMSGRKTLSSVRLYWSADEVNCFSTNFVHDGSRSDTGARAVSAANRFIDKVESFLANCEETMSRDELLMSKDVHKVIQTNYVAYAYVGWVEEYETKFITNVWVVGAKDRSATRLRVPRAVTHIGEGAFSGMYNLTSLTLSSKLKYVGDAAFKECFSLDDIIIPDSVEEIGESAFEDCSWLQTITFGKGLKRIGKNAFKGCTQLQKVVFQDGLCEIEDGAFDGCWRLQSVSLPVSVTKVVETAFTGCSSLKGVTVPTHCGTMATWFKPIYAQIKDATIASGESTVMGGMFAGCSSLENVSFADGGEGVLAIGDGAFQDCVKLTGLTLPESLERLGASAFKGCAALADIALPNNVSQIGSSAFENCTALKDVTLSRSLTSIPDRMFYGCNALDSFTVPESVTYLGSQIVSGSSSYWSKYGTAAIYFLGDAPSYAYDVYSAARSDLASYVVYGTRGWDGRVMSRDIPQQWPTDTTEKRGILTWSPSPFDVTFDATGGTFVNDGSQTYACQQITYTAYALPPYNPTRSGYLFGGWWTERAGGTQVTPSVRVALTKAHTLYAHWTVAGVVRVRFNATGGIVSPEYGSYMSGAPYGDLPVPTREYWDFDGWWTQTAGGTKVVAASEVPTADVELFARWMPATYKIVFHSENGAAYSNTRTETFQYGDTVTLWANEWSCGSATFGGWALEPGGKAVYADQKTLADLSDVRNGELHLYAVWIGDTYAVRFDSNGGTGYMPTQTMVVGVTYNLHTNCFTRSGYAFQGWSQSAGGTRQYSDGERIYSGFSSARKGSTIILYAVWKTIGSCTVTFNSQGGTGSEAQRTVAEGAVIGELPTPKRSGYTFRFWADGPNGGSILSEGTRIYSSRTYYAIWERASDPIFTVSFDAQGGTVGEQIRTVKSGESVGALPTSTRSKYKFDGWYTVSSGGTKVTPSTKVTADVTYYAHWTYDGLATVSVNVGSGCLDMGTVSGGKTAKAGSKVTLKATAKNGYVFAGWYRNAEFDEPVDGDVDYRTPSYSYVVGEDDAAFFARFIPASDDDVEIWTWMDEVYERGVAIEPMEIEVSSKSLPTVKVSGLPTGLKFTTKRIVSKWGMVEAEVSTIYGTPTKSGVYVVTITATTAGKTTVTEQFRMIVRGANEYAVSAKGVYRCPLNACCCEYTPSLGAVSGSGVYAPGKTVTLKAPVAPKGQVFAGWYAMDDLTYADDEYWWGDPPEDFFDDCWPVYGTSDYRNSSMTVTVGYEDVGYYALYMYSDFDTVLSTSLEDRYVWEEYDELPITLESYSLPKISVSGLPAGLKFDSKKNVIYGSPTKPGTYTVKLAISNQTIKKAISQTFEIFVPNLHGGADAGVVWGLDYGADAYAMNVAVANGYPEFEVSAGAKASVAGLPTGLKYDVKSGLITGVPTKAGTYTATITTIVGSNKYTDTVTIKVNALPSWAYGTFNGGSDYGQSQLTITSAGKLSGKYLEDGISYALIAPSYDSYEDGAYHANVTASWTYKDENNKSVKQCEIWPIVVEQGDIGGYVSSSWFDAWQNVWALTEWKQLGTTIFGKSGTVKILAGDEYCLEEGESITLTIKSNGTVTLKGVFDTGVVKNGKSVYYTASGSAVVCPTNLDPFTGKVFVYFAPNAAKGFEGYVRVIPIDE